MTALELALLQLEEAARRVREELAKVEGRDATRADRADSDDDIQQRAAERAAELRRRRGGR